MTLPLARIPDLAAWLAAAGLDELELTGPDGHVRLRRSGPANSLPPHAEVLATGEPRSTRDGGASFEAPLRGAPQDEERGGLEVIASPSVGLFLSAHPLRREPLVRPDQPVVAGQVVALLRVGALLLPVAAPRNGVVAGIVAEDDALVGYGDPLVELWPEA